MSNLTKNKRKRGVAVVMLTLMVGTVLIPMVGLAIDGSILFMVRTKLSAAVDAAALAGARGLSVGNDLDSQIGASTATVSAYLSANFPVGYWGATNPTHTTSIQETAMKTRTVTVDAAVDVPLYFMRVFRTNSSRVAARGQSSRRDVNVMFVLDRSSSMQSAGVCPTMIASARSFVDKFVNGRDLLGLITFMAASRVDYAPTLNFKSNSPSMDATLSTLKCGGNTGSEQALWLGYQQIIAINQPGALNLIVFFTDGLPNGLLADFPVKTQADTRAKSSSPYNQVSTPISPCSSTAAKRGVLVQTAGGADPGSTNGLYDQASVAITSTTQNLIASKTNCQFATSDGKVREDVAYIPNADIHGHSTMGLGYRTPQVFPTGHKYAGFIRPDLPTNITGVSANLFDAAAKLIREDDVYKPVIYVIGLGGTSSEPLDHVLLRRVANDPDSPIYDNSRAPGLYVYAPTATQLNAAFNRVASEILRLAQ